MCAHGVVQDELGVRDAAVLGEGGVCGSLLPAGSMHRAPAAWSSCNQQTDHPNGQLIAHFPNTSAQEACIQFSKPTIQFPAAVPEWSVPPNCAMQGLEPAKYGQFEPTFESSQNRPNGSEPAKPPPSTVLCSVWNRASGTDLPIIPILLVLSEPLSLTNSLKAALTGAE
jgi:hypothetical protein